MTPEGIKKLLLDHVARTGSGCVEQKIENRPAWRTKTIDGFGIE